VYSGYLAGVILSYLVVYEFVKNKKFITLTKVGLLVIIPALWPLFLGALILVVVFLMIKAALR